MGAHAHMLKEVSNGLLNQIHGLTKRFEDQGSNIINAARTLEAQNSKVDTIMEQRQTQLAQMVDGINKRASELDRMMHHYSNMLEQSLTQAEQRAKQVTELLARDSADKSQTAVKELERLRAEAQAHTARAISELKSSFSSLSEQVANQLSGFTSSFTETTQQVRSSAHQAASELELAQTELKRQAKTLPETTKQSAKAMRRALQDQLSALDSLTELTQRHGYSSQIAKPEPQNAPGEPGRQQPRAPQQPAQGDPFDMTAFDNPRRDMPPQSSRGGYTEEWGAPRDPLAAVSAGVMERMDRHPQSGTDPGSRAPMSPAPVPGFDMNDDRGGAKWSLGDLLARASRPDDNFAGGDEQSYGMPPIAAPIEGGRKGEASPMVFDMKDIANAVDEDVAAEVWRRYNKGEQNIISRSIYNREGQATFEQVKRRYENDTTFRHIVDRYLADFERMLQDASKADPKGRTVQTHLVSETGRIYLVLGHASGRLMV